MSEWIRAAPVDGPQLRVMAAALEGYRFTVRNAGTALRLVLFPALCISGVHFALSGFAPPPEDIVAAADELALTGLGELAAMILLIPVVLVAWQRRILLGPEHAKMRLGRREGRMLVALLLLGLMVFLGNLVAMTVGEMIAGLAGEAAVDVTVDILIVATKLATAYVTGRLYFLLPPRAMDRKLTVKEAWGMSAGYGLKLMAIVVLIGAPMMILSQLAAGLGVVALENGAVGLLVGANLIGNMLFMFSLVVEAAALTVCYAALGGIEDVLEVRGIGPEFEAAPA